MANTDQNITELPIKTASEVLDADYMLGIDLVEGYQVSTKDFADYAVNRAAISIGGKTQTTASAISEVRTTAGNAQPKESGKGLSANDFTNAYKSKLDGIAAGAEVNVQSDWNASSGDAAILHKPTTISGYGITDAYTKTQVDTSLAAKSDKATTYTKSDVDAIVNTDDDTSEAANPLILETDSAQYAKSTIIEIEPIQDLHGQSNPYPAGGGKNLLPMTVEWIKTFNTGGTWNGNTYTADGITFTLQTNSTGAVIGVVVNGTSTGLPQIRTGRFDTGTGTYTFSTNVSNGSSNTFYGRYVARDSNGTAINIDGSVFIDVYTTEATKTVPSNTVCIDGYIGVANGVTVNNVVFKPMIRLSSVSDATFAPYSNICPITPMGHRNLLQVTAQSQTINGVTFTVNDDGSVVVNGTATGNNIWFTLGTVNLTGVYTISGCPVGGSGSTYTLVSQGVTNVTEYGGGASVTYDGTAKNIYIYIQNGYTANNLVFKPMIRLVSDTEMVFVPYGKTRIVTKATTGKNMLNWKDFVQGSVSGTGLDTVSLSRLRSPFAKVEPLTNYTYSTNSDVLVYEIEFYDANRNWIDYRTVNNTSRTVETIQNTEYIKVLLRKSNDSTITVDEGEGFQMELGSTATAYEPYKGYTASLDLPEPVYSGTLDLETGVVVADKVLWSANTSSMNNIENYPGWTNCGIANIVGYGLNNTLRNMVGSIGTSVSVNTTNTGGTGTVFFTMEDYGKTQTEWKSLAVDVQFIFRLVTPITYQLTPQQLALFKGINNISTNANTVQVTYRNGELATTGDIVESTEVAKRSILGESESYTDARLATELAPILGNFATAETSPASASHAVGEYLLYNNRLYKVLAAISAGQQLTIGTNIGQTNVAAELASQASAISALNSKSLFYRTPTVTSITSNTDLWNMGTGIYLISLSSASEYIPARWGILVVFNCMTDAAYFYLTTFGESYLRIAYNLISGTTAWRYDWKRIDNS